MISQQQVKMEICVSLNINYTLEQISKLQLIHDSWLLREADYTLCVDGVDESYPYQSQQEIRETKQAHKSDSVIFEVVCAALILHCEQEQLLSCLFTVSVCFQYLTILAVRYSKQSISGVFSESWIYRCPGSVIIPEKCLKSLCVTLF